VNLSNESAGTVHIPFSMTRLCPDFPANVRNRSFHICSGVTSIPLHAPVEIIDKKSFADCRFLVSVAIDNLLVLSEFILIFLHNFDDFNLYFRFFWDHWWSILQQLPSACIKYISCPIRIVPSQDLGLSCDCFEIVLFGKLYCSFIDWNVTWQCFANLLFLLWIFWLILEIAILISIHILIRCNIQASVALTAMEANNIAGVYLSEISMCCQTSATIYPTWKTEHQVSEGAPAWVCSLSKSFVRDVISSRHAMCN
jgi:hypothetical protein